MGVNLTEKRKLQCHDAFRSFLFHSPHFPSEGAGAMLRSAVRAPRSALRLLPSNRRHLETGKWRPTNPRLPRLQNTAIRFASTVAQESLGLAAGIKNAIYGTSLILGFGLLYFYITDTRASAHRWMVVPALRILYPDPEDAHRAGNSALKALWQFGLYPRERLDPDKRGDLQVEVFGHTLTNPIATSAGIDKHADIPNPLFAIGPSIIEIGGTTPLPQDGNEKPRVFRLPSQRAFINRYGLNSEGADHVAMRLRQRVREFAHSMGFGYDAPAERFVLDGHAGVPPGSLINGKLLAVNIAKNKFTPENDIEAVERDYVYCVERLAPYADILVVNVSSPNTPGLRSLQQTGPLTKILTGVVKAAKQTDRTTKPAIMVKVSLDEDSDEQITGICQAVWESGVDGVIVGNTTNRRPGPMPSLRPFSPLEEQTLLEQGGFSGPHLFERTVALVKRYKKLLDGRPSPTLKDGISRADVETKARENEGLLQKEERSKKASSGSTGKKPLDSVQSSIDTGRIALRPPPDNEQSAVKQPLFNPPKERFFDQSKTERDRLTPTKEVVTQLSAPEETTATAELSKVIFATGGITSGKQALEVLNAGASVAMVYTALVYGGVGTISRIKDEMREEIKAATKTKKKATQL